MTTKRLAQLQWFGLFAGAIGIAVAQTLGFGLAIAQCNVGSARWGISNDPVEAAILSSAALVTVLAGTASATIVVRTQGTSFDDDPPLARIRFLAIGALVANVLFAAIVLLALFGNVLNGVCTQA